MTGPQPLLSKTAPNNANYPLCYLAVVALLYDVRDRAGRCRTKGGSLPANLNPTPGKWSAQNMQLQIKITKKNSDIMCFSLWMMQGGPLNLICLVIMYGFCVVCIVSIIILLLVILFVNLCWFWNMHYYHYYYYYGRCPLMEENLWWKKTIDGKWPSIVKYFL